MNNQGLTIIELLIYIFILSMLVAMIGIISINVFQSGARTEAVQEVTHNGRFALQKIGQLTEAAERVEDPETEGSQLQLLVEGSQITFHESEGVLMMGEDELTTSKVSVSNLNFKRVSDNSIKVEFLVSLLNPENAPEYEFSNYFSTAFTLN